MIIDLSSKRAVMAQTLNVPHGHIEKTTRGKEFIAFMAQTLDVRIAHIWKTTRGRLCGRASEWGFPPIRTQRGNGGGEGRGRQQHADP
jgi:hypothetical protein